MMSNTHSRRVALAAIFLASWSDSGSAQSPTLTTPVPAASAIASPAATTTAAQKAAGGCVLLQNDHVLFGTAQQIGEFVVVKTGPHSEVRLPRQEVACWAYSLRDLYQYRVDHRVGSGIDAHLSEARWCLLYELTDHAAKELQAAKTLDPGNRQIKLMEDQLRRATAKRDSLAPAKPALSTASVQAVNYEDGEPEMVGIDLETLRHFASNVQPLLLNRCGHCHGQDSNRDWSLLVPSTGTRPSARMARENMAASLRYIDAVAPEESELLRKAMTAHGGTAAPLDPRHFKAIEAFKAWLASASQIALRPSNAWPAPAAEAAAPLSPPQVANRQPLEAAAPTGVKIVPIETPPAETPSTAGPASNDAGPARLPQVANPFDPDLFNRRFHRDQAQ